ncbi:tagaturonate epimerase family protein [Peloplasma aerotolerans]|uniref:Tagaturonate/fructuronate epimerase n=1 Tax=Peloplasma aerotolerans TaxID=3044389 RepID=A0AAW6U523_9MOLU|nr:tagaturonate epimerase family protein [Mariniplasma sp. M4Ah]MDI6453017.1 tagaturonate epimerase family protein [Mariniplasma sp. M4Ah]
MSFLHEFILSLPNTTDAEKLGVYENSINQFEESWVFMIKGETSDFLIVAGPASKKFEGDEFLVDSITCIKANLTHKNGNVLREMFPFTKPIPVLQSQRSFGVGDRLGLAGPGHIKVFKEYDAYPILAQQSIRELTLTNRTYEDVLDSASFYAFREGYKDGFGADGDHLKKPSEVEYALSLGYTMITLDCSDYIRNDVQEMSKEQVDEETKLTEVLKKRYLNQTFDVEGMKIHFTEEELKRNVLVYGEAIEFATAIYKKYFIEQKANANFEISIDETATPTSPTQHYFVANELTLNEVKLDTMAPRFCGEFQKGVDYIGDITQFEEELKIHAAIARKYGYKLSIHSGSDKFSIFALIGKHTRGNFHVKTAGTNWLEAMRAVAACDAKLYREIHKYALSMFDEAQKFYHVTTDLTKIPNIDELIDEELVDLFKQNDARQLIHITYGFILSAKDNQGEYLFKTKLYNLWHKEADVYAEMLYQHIGKHLKLLYSGIEK